MLNTYTAILFATKAEFLRMGFKESAINYDPDADTHCVSRTFSPLDDIDDEHPLTLAQKWAHEMFKKSCFIDVNIECTSW